MLSAEYVFSCMISTFHGMKLMNQSLKFTLYTMKDSYTYGFRHSLTGLKVEESAERQNMF